jgi:prolyl-tRNA editing enzyme YbaK/EbsC (Cys-tRNA(Pro) deacylase)
VTIAALVQFLDGKRVRYRILEHARAVIAEAAARAAGVPPSAFAKGVLVKVRDRPPGRWILVVVPANSTVDLDALREHLGFPVELASEQDLQRVFPTDELGAAPPIAPLAVARLPVFVDPAVIRAGTIVFRAGTHAAVVEVEADEFARAIAAQLLSCARPKSAR